MIPDMPVEERDCAANLQRALKHAQDRGDKLSMARLKAEEQIELLMKALEDAVSALDSLLGDSDVDNDDSPEFLACQKGNLLLQSLTKGKQDA